MRFTLLISSTETYLSFFVTTYERMVSHVVHMAPLKIPEFIYMQKQLLLKKMIEVRLFLKPHDMLFQTVK